MNQLGKSSTGFNAGQWEQQLAELRERITSLSKRTSREAKAGYETRALVFFQQILELHDLQTGALDLAIPRLSESQESAADTLAPPRSQRRQLVTKLFEFGLMPICDVHEIRPREHVCTGGGKGSNKQCSHPRVTSHHTKSDPDQPSTHQADKSAGQLPADIGDVFFDVNQRAS